MVMIICRYIIVDRTFCKYLNFVCGNGKVSTKSDVLYYYYVCRLMLAGTKYFVYFGPNC